MMENGYGTVPSTTNSDFTPLFGKLSSVIRIRPCHSTYGSLWEKIKITAPKFGGIPIANFATMCRLAHRSPHRYRTSVSLTGIKACRFPQTFTL